jgi:hypothetical protein
VLFPISLVPFDTIREWKNFDADIVKDSAREIREYYIPDFSEWENQEKYQAAFEHLIRDLRDRNAEPIATTSTQPRDEWNPGAAAIAAAYRVQAVRAQRGRQIQITAAYVEACRKEGRDPANPGAGAVIGSSNGEFVGHFRKQGTR